jgi:hypothetical protein
MKSLEIMLSFYTCDLNILRFGMDHFSRVLKSVPPWVLSDDSVCVCVCVCVREREREREREKKEFMFREFE